ncbi:MAG: DNA translocase FtsK [Clostridiales bacterium]|jgi:S-DNA-T family DNA segregation ATPase FtsK/SpoIIIE|nr:DNA translocase FtsK [Clostridiales bacterium]
MGRTTQKKKNAKKTAFKSEVQAIIFFALGLLLFFSFISKAGPLGKFIALIFFFLFCQIASFLIIFGFFVAGIRLFKEKQAIGGSTRNKILFCVFILVLSALVHTISFSNPCEKTGFFPSVSWLFTSYNLQITGGLLGGGFSLLLQLLLRKLGTLVVLFPAALVLAMFLFSFSLRNIFRKASGGVESIRKKFYGKKKPNVPNPKVDGPKMNYIDETSPDKDISGRRGRIKEVINELNGNTETAEFSEIQMSGFDKPKETIKPMELKKTNLNDDVEYIFPPYDLLKSNDSAGSNDGAQKSLAAREAKKLEDVLLSFKIEAKVVNICRGPSVTRYELQPNSGVKVATIKNLSDDIALNLAAPSVRIEAPIPGKAAIGIEIPNKEVAIVYLKDVIQSPEFINHKSNLSFCLGVDISGEKIVGDIAKMPHLMIAGSTGSGKSVCVNCLIMSLLYKASPKDVRLIMVDPKVVELGVYNGIPHLLIPVVTDPKKAAGALAWAVQEMVGRYNSFAQSGVRDLEGYNVYAEANGLEKMPQIVIIIDELADLMMVAHDSVEDSICRLAQMARAAGMHLVIATQRPSVDVITGIIKANIASRIGLKVASQVGSRTIMDNGGAEKLLGRGDMLFLPVGSMKATRIQGAFVSESEVESVVEFIKSQCEAQYDDDVFEEVNINAVQALEKSQDKGEDDELLPQAVDIALKYKQISTSFLQRQLKIGYNRAARLIDQMEEKGIISGKDGSNPRQVLVDMQAVQ